MRRIYPVWNRGVRTSRTGFNTYSAGSDCSSLTSNSSCPLTYSIGEGREWSSLPKILVKNNHFVHRSSIRGKMYYA